MRVGVPKEIKVLENRVGLTPSSVREFVARGHTVEVEHDAGAGIGLHDDAYVAAGATIARSADAVFIPDGGDVAPAIAQGLVSAEGVPVDGTTWQEILDAATKLGVAPATVESAAGLA
mgnify:CR=1 FL=1